MRIITAAVVTAIFIGGCAAARDTMVYEKPGVSEEQKRQDEAACTLAALDTAAQHGAAFLYVDRDTVNDCMRARGYKVWTGT
jgi:PBP1b-binding outer membrane lipoprotein LpoB